MKTRKILIILSVSSYSVNLTCRKRKRVANLDKVSPHSSNFNNW